MRVLFSTALLISAATAVPKPKNDGGQIKSFFNEDLCIGHTNTRIKEKMYWYKLGWNKIQKVEIFEKANEPTHGD